MKRRLTTLIGAVAMFALVAGFASTAQALPTYTSACSGCHSLNSGVHVSATQLTNNGTTASYQIAVSGTGSSPGWTVLEGSTNKGSGSNAGGTVALSVGHAYNVWGVHYGTGSARITITPAAPTTTPPPPPPPSGTTTLTTAITCKRSATVINYGGRITLSGRLTPGAYHLPIGIYQRKPHSTVWTRVATTYTTSGGYWTARRILKIRGLWYFRAKFLGDATRLPSTSPYYGVKVR